MTPPAPETPQTELERLIEELRQNAVSTRSLLAAPRDFGHNPSWVKLYDVERVLAALRATEVVCQRCGGARVDTYVDESSSTGFTERPCPACTLVRASEGPREAEIVMTAPTCFSGRLGVGARSWAELEDIEKRGAAQRNIPSSGMIISWGTFQTVMNALRHCGEKHYLNPSEAEGPLGLITECCGVHIDGDWRFCPKCGYEARVHEAEGRQGTSAAQERK